MVRRGVELMINSPRLSSGGGGGDRSRRRRSELSSRVVAALCGALWLCCGWMGLVYAKSDYMGCFRDIVEVKDRVLPNVLVIEPKMTTAMCLSICDCRGFPFAGTQFGVECWCGWSPPATPAIGDKFCSTPCGGDSWSKCGGPLSLSVYRNQLYRKPDHPLSLLHSPASEYENARLTSLLCEPQRKLMARPLLTLLMMVKDEAHTLANTLRNVRPVVDSWHILDTGSEDGTQALIRTEFSAAGSAAAAALIPAAAPPKPGGTAVVPAPGQPLPGADSVGYSAANRVWTVAAGKAVPGRLLEEPFVDYGTSRNRVMNFANTTAPELGFPVKPIFGLMLSADEVVTRPHAMRTFLEANRLSEGPQHGAYPVLMNAGIDFDSIRLSRVDEGWRYVGKVHEYMGAPDDKWHELYRSIPEPIRVDFRATDHTRRYRSQYLIARTLEAELVTRPNHTRSLFYLARTYTVLSNWTFAYDTFERLAKCSQWEEEKYDAMLAMGSSAQAMGKPFHFIVSTYLNAYEFLPLRIDAPHTLSEMYHQRGLCSLSLLYSRVAHAMEMPKSAATVQNVLLRRTQEIYDWQASRILSLCLNKILPVYGALHHPIAPFFRMNAPPPPPGAIPPPPPPAATPAVDTLLAPAPASAKLVASPPTIVPDALARHYAELTHLRSEYQLCIAATEKVNQHRPSDTEMQTIRRTCQTSLAAVEAAIEIDRQIATRAGITLSSAIDTDSTAAALAAITTTKAATTPTAKAALNAANLPTPDDSVRRNPITLLGWVTVCVLCAALSLGVGRLRQRAKHARTIAKSDSSV